MTSLSGTFFPTGNVDFAFSQNEWIQARIRKLGGQVGKSITLNPSAVNIQLCRSSEVGAESTAWLDDVGAMINACTKVIFQIRDSALRLVNAVYQIDQNRKLMFLFGPSAVDSYARKYWNRVAYFYAHRHDGFRFDLVKIISMKDASPERPEKMELSVRIVQVPDRVVPTLTFDATGATCNVHIVEWRGDVKEETTGRFRKDDLETRIVVRNAKQPVILLHENRPEFNNRAHVFSGEALDDEIRRMLKKASQRSDAV